QADHVAQSHRTLEELRAKTPDGLDPGFRRDAQLLDAEAALEAAPVLDPGRLADTDLDDARRPGPLQQPAHAGAGDPEESGDLRLPALLEVVETAGANEQVGLGGLDIEHAREHSTYVHGVNIRARARLATRRPMESASRSEPGAHGAPSCARPPR